MVSDAGSSRKGKVRSSSVPVGGPSNINGIHYQLLWCLLRALKSHVEIDERDAEGRPARTILRIEPRDGGDVQELAGGSRRVIQLKSRSTGQTWSLGEIVDEVLPGLYGTIDLSDSAASYDFITNAEMGDWGRAYQLFRSLKEFPSEPQAQTCLDDQKQLTFARGWGRATEHQFFEAIVNRLRETSRAAKSEPQDETRRKTWHLLARFSFIGGQTLDDIKRDIDSQLLALVDSKEQITDKRGALLEELANRASTGSADIDTAEFLATVGLAAVPLTEWSRLRTRANHEFKEALEFRQYDQILDVRTHRARGLASRWSAGGSAILALSGESGEGRTWLLYGLGVAILPEPQIVVAVESTGNAGRDLQRAADIFWQAIADHDESIPLERIVARRRDVLHRHSEQWMVILLDGLQDAAEAVVLARTPLEKWGVKLVVTGTPDAVEALRLAAEKGDGIERVQVERVLSFSASERDDYIERRIGDSWITIPADVKETLRRPLLARIYCDISAPTGWNPTNEYELYEKFWRGLYVGQQSNYPGDEPALARLALRILEEGSYPWPASTIAALGIEDLAVGRLIRTGWLRRAAPDNRFEVPHDRLLNFAVAHALTDELVQGRRTVAALADLLREMLTSPHRTYSGRHLWYVPMDVVYLTLSGDDGIERATQLIASIESGENFQMHEALYSELLPTLGEKAIPLLFNEINRVADEWSSHQIEYIADGFPVSMTPGCEKER